MLRKLCATTLLFACCAFAVSAQENRWYDSFFVETSGQYYFTPGFFSELVKPDAGFRGALGYEWRRWRFGLESGYTHISGANPLVLDLRFVPLALKTGYALPLAKGWGLQADLDIGFIFSKTAHYKNAIEMLTGNRRESSARSFMAGARVFGTYTFVRGVLKLFAGGGVDAVFENEGAIPLPLFEAGVSFKPLALVRLKARGGEPDEDSIPIINR